MQNFIGIDVSKDSFNYSVVGEKMNEVQSGSFKMDREGFESFKDVVQGCPNCVVVMESTGIYHINLLGFISSFKEEVAVVNPSLIKRFSQNMTLRKTKTDEIGAFVIARFASKYGDIIRYFVPHNMDEITALSRVRESISKDIARVKTQIKGHMSVVFPELASKFNLFTDAMLAVIEAYPTPETVRKATHSSVNKFIGNLKYNRNITHKELKELAKKSIGVSSSVYEDIIRHDARHLRFLLAEQEAVQKRFIDEIDKTKKDDLDILKSIKGIGEITASHFIAEIKDIKRFESKKRLIAFAGTDPSIRQSGTSINTRGRISKKGSKSLRRYIYLMASGVMKFNDYFRAYYLKKRQEGFQHRKAMIALANKLLRVVWSMLTKRECFNV